MLPASPKEGGCGGMNRHDLGTSSVVLARQPRHGRVQTSVARHYLPTVKIQHVASVVCELPPSLLEYHTSRSQIPRPDAPLVVAVQPPRCHVAQIKRRRTQAPHALGGSREASKELQCLGHRCAVVGEAGHDKSPDQLVGIRYSDGLTVQRGTAASLGHVDLFPHRVVYYTQDHLTGSLERYGDAEDGQPVGVVGGAIQGIYDPAGVHLSYERSSLLGQHSVGGESSEKDLPDHLLCLLVHLRDKVNFTLVPDGVLPAEAFAQHLACFLRC